jgi:predicted O-linked N-acetylglucosamine transferase (SPINDLY family)
MDEVGELRRAVAAHEAGRMGEAARLYESIAQSNPKNILARNLLGLLLVQAGRPADGLRWIDEALRLAPRDAQALENRGMALSALGRHGEAVAAYDLLIGVRPLAPEGYEDRAEALLALGRVEEAARDLQTAFARGASSPLSYHRLGFALHRLGRFAEALTAFDHALKADAAFAAAFNDRGNTLRALKRMDEARASFERAIALAPQDPAAYVNLANVLVDMRQLEKAHEMAQRALALRPALASAHIAAGNALLGLDCAEDALISFDRALAVSPNHVGAVANRADVLKRLGRFEEAARGFERALQLKPDLPYRFGELVHVKLLQSDWRSFDQDMAELNRRVDAGELATMPFPLLVMPSTPARQLAGARAHVRAAFGESFPPAPPPRPHEKIRIGYFSSDLYEHATAYLLAGVIELHDRSRFEITAFDFSLPQEDAMRGRLRAAFDHWIDIKSLSDEQAAGLARAQQIDIAVDLKGFTTNGRAGVFAQRAAPVQVSWLGYPGTTGTPFFDYLIADRILVPAEEQQHYSEKIAYLPHSYQPNDPKRAIAARQFSRAELGLPNAGFVFCSFNNNYKITPDLFDVWMRLLRAVDGSVLWLLEDNAAGVANLRAEAVKRGVAPERLVFAPRMKLGDHLARHAGADLFLDSFYCSAHTTASDALWAGLPLLTKRGVTLAGRVAASLLSAVGLPDLITESAEAYEALALAIARDPARLEALRAKLRAHRAHAPLFDAARFTRDLESAFTAMNDRALAGLAPETIVVE